MDHGFPVYTVRTACQDCYKCVRQCQAKAIKIEDGHASIIPQLCTACAHCVEVCPVHAKKIRDDQDRLRLLMQQKKRVFVSLAPSWVAEFPGMTPEGLVAKLKRAGFAGVSETALGAQEVSFALQEQLRRAEPGLYISTACPAVVEYVCKHLPQYRSMLVQMPSPLLAHSRFLREYFGEDIGIVFFGPCAAKKLEADRHPELLDLALTFSELRRLLSDIDEDSSEEPEAEALEGFTPFTAEHGRIYPIDGGMIESMADGLADCQLETMVVSGMHALEYHVTRFNPEELDRPVFLETLACEGGCINGPGRTHKEAGIVDRLQVRKNTPKPPYASKRMVNGALPETILTQGPKRSDFISDERLEQALADVGKTSAEDELNCGGCGYETCQAFARAMLDGMAEPSMCVSFMREKAQRKANALLRCMPSAVVIVDDSLKIIECNRRFAEMFGEDTMLAYIARPGLEGANLETIVPFASLFQTTLESGEDVQHDHVRNGERLFNLSFFTITPQQVIGAIIQDVTEIENYRDQIARRANEVLQKNLLTVQDIACRLGEHMADTEILLRSISKGFSRDEYD